MAAISIKWEAALSVLDHCGSLANVCCHQLCKLQAELSGYEFCQRGSSKTKQESPFVDLLGLPLR